jgi:phosphoadenosine phosphosulfate reductase
MSSSACHRLFSTKTKGCAKGHLLTDLLKITYLTDKTATVSILSSTKNMYMREKQKAFATKARAASRTFSPGKSDIFWCDSCNVPLLSGRCSVCGASGRTIHLSPPADVRLCSSSCRELLADLFERIFGYAEFLNGHIILLNKIAGIDRRDQVILDGHHIATLWFDITSGTFRLDLELAGAAMIAGKASKSVVVCSESVQKGHLKGKWIEKESIIKWPEDLSEGDSVILRIGKYIGAGVVRKRGGSMSIRVKDVATREFSQSERASTIENVVKANEAHLKRLEKAAVRELRDYLSRTKLPVNVSFSGGKDSLAALCLCLKVRPNPDVLFINTQLEFPETVDYVRKFCTEHNLKFHEIREDKNEFFEQLRDFGPPAKDFRWCCKTNKLGPLTSFIQRQYPRGCMTVEGRRVYESFSRSKIGAVDKNPYVPNQTTLCPIRSWNALEVMLYIHWNRLQPNPLYESDYERIGCWLCPASLQSEFENTKRTHPQMYEQWDSYLRKWAKENNLDTRYIDWGFWRWKRHPPKIAEIAAAHNVSLEMRPAKKKDARLSIVKGRSPCGVKYSIEGSLSVPQRYPFKMVANALGMLGDVKYSEDLGVAILEADDCRGTVFANGHILVVAPKDSAEDMLRRIVETILRVQTCTRCRICEKRCKRRAITVKDTISVDEKRCTRCGKCVQGCIAAAQASKMFSGPRPERKG